MSNELSKIVELKKKLKNGSGSKTARKRIEKFFDQGSFIETGLFIHEAAITGYGQVNGRLVYAMIQDAEIGGGAVTSLHAEKILRCQDDAMKVGAPIVYINDSNGVKLSEGVEVLSSIGKVLAKATELKGVVPQISLSFGKCEGALSFLSSTCDFTFAVNDVNADLSARTEDECIAKAKELLSYLPQNYTEGCEVIDNGDDLNRLSNELNDLVPTDDATTFDMIRIINAIADNNIFFEIKKDFGKDIIVGFIRLGGASVAVIASNSSIKDASLDRDAVDKAVKFLETCDLLAIPILTLVDTDGIIDKHTSELVEAYSLAETSLVTIIVRRAYGSGYIAMGSRELGADIVYAYPEAKIGVMKPEALSHIINDKVMMEASAAAEKGLVDDVIEPSATRKMLIAAFDMLDTKAV